MRLVVVFSALALLFATGATATSSEQPPWVDNESTALTATCGGLRAEVIARMDYARKIHVSYLTMLPADPALAKRAGDANWQKYWIDTYVQTIKLLKQGCATAG